MADSSNKQVLSQEVFDYLMKNAPDFLRSYSVLASFYVRITEEYSHKTWKDGRIVLTPIKSVENEKS
jgi:hypothetical protein